MTKQKNATFSPIAVVGASGLFPGSVGGQSFWRNILAGEDFMTEVPEDHWLIDDYYDPEPAKPGKIYGRRGAFLPRVDFDPMAFGMPPKQLSTTDTAQLLGLIVAGKVLDDAASVQFGKVDKSDISVILGVASATELVGQMVARIQRPNWVKALRDAGIPESKVQQVCDGIEATYPEWDESTFPGLLGNVVAGRIANRLDLGGTNCVVDAACASSLGAVSMAVRELQSGSSDLVITGGVDALNDIFMYMCFSQTPALSSTGDCRPFSADADGTMLGEGIGMVALRRLDDARRDGDRIYAVIRGLGTSSDGRSGSIYAPESRGQSLAIRRAYDMTDYDVDEVGLIEAHGTATKAGDAAEFGGLEYAFEGFGEDRKQWCALGSVKSQIGHTKSAAGAASLFKVVMALHHKVLPGTIKVSEPNPALNIDDSPFYLNTRTRPWIHDPRSTRKGSVSSFGFGGSNFHVTLEEYNQPGQTRARYHNSPVELLLFSGNTTDELAASASTAVERLPDHALPTLARQLQHEFSATDKYRLAIIAESGAAVRQQIGQALEKISAGPDEAFSLPNRMHFGVGDQRQKIGFLFPGQGSQYVGMGSDLACEFDQARKVWDAASTAELDSELRLDQVVFPIPVFSDADRAGQADLLTSTDWAQPAIGCVSESMLALLDTLELKPDAVAGHSYGEVAALYAAGAITSPSDLLAVSRRRGVLMKQAAASTPGSMTAVRASVQEVQAYLDEWDLAVSVANINSPNQVVIAGETAQIKRAEKQLDAVGASYRRLPVATAFHTDIVSPSAEPFHTFLGDISIGRPSLAVYSNTTASPYGTDPDEIRGRLARQLANPVRFQELIEQMHDDGIRLFLEVGPNALLSGMVKDCLKGREFTVVSMDNRKLDGRSALWNALASLSAAGVPLNFAALWQDFAAAEPPLDSRKKSPVTVQLGGANYGKPYPPANGAAGIPAPNPEMPAGQTAPASAPSAVEIPAPDAGLASASAAAVTATPEAPTAGRQAARDANWVAAFQSLQQQTLEAQKSFQNTLAEAHQAFLRASEVAFTQLGGAAPVDVALAPAPAIQADAAPVKLAAAGAGGSAVAMPAAAPDAPPAPRPVAVAAAPRSEPLATTTAAAPDFAAMLLDIVAEKTGYPVEMLTLDMELEAGLGIDSIKRVEILSALQEQLPHLGELDTSELAALNTLGEIIDFAGASAAATPQLATSDAIAAPESDVQGLLLDVVAEKTGYPVEMLSLDMELEAGLGIDSIKRVEILSALQEQIPHLGQLDTAALAELNTLGEIITFAGATAPASASASAAPHSSEQQASATPADIDFTGMLLNVVAEKTGYPQEMLSLDMELESGLGIDSIKRVEILSALQEQVPQLGEIDTAELAELNTLSEIITLAAGASSAAGAVDRVGDSPVQPAPALLRGEIVAEPRPAAEIAIGQIQHASPLYLVGDRTGVAEPLRELLLDAGIETEIAEKAPKSAQWMVLLTGLNAAEGGSIERLVKLNIEAFEQSRCCAEAMSERGKLLVTVQATGGDFGLSGSSDLAWSSGLAALAKTASKEWPAVAVKAIDVGTEHQSPAQIAQALFTELTAGGPELEVGLPVGSERITLVSRASGKPGEPTAAPLAQDSVVVVSGGARGVTAACLQELLARRPAQLAILGRTPLADEPAGLAGFTTDGELKKALLTQSRQAGRAVTPLELNQQVGRILNAREVRANLQLLQATGSDVLYIATDITDPQSVEAAVAEVRKKFGPINMLVHAAGVLADKEIAKKTDQQFQSVFYTKVAGLQNLLQATVSDPLTHLVCFSSVAARVGNKGQVDYAMANEILNRVCRAEQNRRGGSFLAKSIGWGPWAGGMVDPALAGHFRAQGVALIPLDDGAKLFADEVERRNGDCVEIVYGGGLGNANETSVRQLAMRVHSSRQPQIASHLIQGEPVVPLAMVNEWCLCIASALLPSASAVDVRDLKVLKGIQLAAFDGAGDWLSIDCRMRDDGTLLDVTVSDSDGAPHYQAAVAVGGSADSSGHPAREPGAAAKLELERWEWEPEKIYQDFLFHGESLQVVKKLLGVSDRGCSGILQMPDDSDLKSWRVALLDGGLQLALLWERHRSGLASLPTGFGHMRWYQAEKSGGPVTCELIRQKASKLAVTWSIVFTDSEKQLIATMDDVNIHVLPGNPSAAN